MVTGASSANLAILLIDAQRGVLTQTKRHSFIAPLLGIPRLLIAINKMDLVAFSERVFDTIVSEYTEFATRLAVLDIKFVPVSALHGDNVVERSPRTPWYRGESILEYLETVYVAGDRNLVDFRMPVQYVLRPSAGGRAVCGQIASGVVKRGDEVMVLPSRTAGRVKSLVELVAGEPVEQEYAFAPMSVTLTLDREIDVSRGDMLVHPRNLPLVQSSFEAMLVWLDAKAMDPSLTYVVKHTTRGSRATIEGVDYRVDVNTLSRVPAAPLQLNEIGRVAFRTRQPVFIDTYRKNRAAGLRTVHPHTNHTVAAGMIIDRQAESGSARSDRRAGAPGEHPPRGGPGHRGRARAAAGPAGDHPLGHRAARLREVLDRQASRAAAPGRRTPRRGAGRRQPALRPQPRPLLLPRGAQREHPAHRRGGPALQPGRHHRSRGCHLAIPGGPRARA
jgi:sulfate adenylyltransferase large subunit